MGSPNPLYKLFSNEELAAELIKLKAEITGGTIESLGGAAKSSSFRTVPIEDRMKAMLLEMRARGLQPPRAQKVVNTLELGNCGDQFAYFP